MFTPLWLRNALDLDFVMMVAGSHDLAFRFYLMWEARRTGRLVRRDVAGPRA